MSVRGVDRLALDLLGRHVLGRADHQAGLREVGVLDRLGDAEVGDLHPAVAAQQDVGGLHVAVHEPGAVGGVERLGDLGGERRRPATGRSGVGSSSRCAQRLARARAPSRWPRCPPPSRCRRWTRSRGGRAGRRPPPPGGTGRRSCRRRPGGGGAASPRPGGAAPRRCPATPGPCRPDATSSLEPVAAGRGAGPASTVRGSAPEGRSRACREAAWGSTQPAEATRGPWPRHAAARRAAQAGATQVTPMTRGPPWVPMTGPMCPTRISSRG